MDLADVLKELSTYAAVSGYERQMSLYIKGLFEEKCDSVEIDKFYNVAGFKKGTGNGSRKIMVTAHYDEIGFLVKSIDEKGFLRLANVGGIDAKILLSQEVIIHGKRDVPGVIGAKPPHLMKPEEEKKAVKLGDLSVDTGMSLEKVREVISIGDAVTLKATPFVLNGNKISGKAMDNRSSIAALLETMSRLSELKHEADVYFVATVQEEVGLRGAVITAYNVRPDIAIVIDACHGDMPDVSRDTAYALGKGPAIGIGPNLHKNLTKGLMEVAKEENISFQVDVEPGDTGTEAWATQVSRGGIPTLLISIPVRYMHTPVETVHTEDIKNTGKLAARFIAAAGREEIRCC